MIGYRIVSLLIGYLFGLFQTAFFIGKAHNIDIREVGSGNAGTTNTLRTFGLKAGLLTLLMDVVKCFAAICLVRFMLRGRVGELLPLMEMYAGAGCILGHNFPFYMNFRGGKGIAATLGMFLALDWRIGVSCFALFLVILFTTHYVSLGSICAYLTAFILVVVLGALGSYGMDLAHTIEMDAVMGLLALMTILKHKGNIKRLLNGTERKTYLTGRNKTRES